MYDVVIIGSGPAGLCASIYARRAGLKAVTLEKAPMSGGQVLNTYEVDNYPGFPGMNGFELGMKFKEHADKLQCEFQEGTVVKIRKEPELSSDLKAAATKAADEDEDIQKVFAVETEDSIFYTRAVVAAMGAYHARLNIPGEKEFAGAGVSYCATCDGAFFRGRTTAVIGGGDVAVEDAIYLARSCEKVYLIHRRDALRAAGILQEKVKSLPNVQILWDTVAESIEGNGQVEGLCIRNVKTGRKERLEVDGVFVAVGIIPDSGVLEGIVRLNEKGYVVAGEDGESSEPGIFAAGDIRDKKLRQIVTAVADGANAISAVEKYLAAGNNK